MREEKEGRIKEKQMPSVDRENKLIKTIIRAKGRKESKGRDELLKLSINRTNDQLSK